MGGLVEDIPAPSDMAKGAAKLQHYWAKVAAVTEAPTPDPLRWTTRSSHPSGRLVKAAERQDVGVADAVMRRLRESTFVWGEPPDDDERALHAVRGVAGLDEALVAGATRAQDAADAYFSDTEETRDPNQFVRALTGDRVGIGNAKDAADGRKRYAFPTLLFRGQAGEHTVPGWMDYGDYEAAMEAAEPGSTADPAADPTPSEALQQWPLVTGRELEILCGPDAEPPPGSVTHRYDGGVVHMTAAEAIPLGVV